MNYDMLMVMIKKLNVVFFDNAFAAVFYIIKIGSTLFYSPVPHVRTM